MYSLYCYILMLLLWVLWYCNFLVIFCFYNNYQSMVIEYKIFCHIFLYFSEHFVRHMILSYDYVAAWFSQRLLQTKTIYHTITGLIKTGVLKNRPWIYCHDDPTKTAFFYHYIVAFWWDKSEIYKSKQYKILWLFI